MNMKYPERLESAFPSYRRGQTFSGKLLDEEAVLAELSQLPTFFGFFVLIFIVKPRVFIVAF